MSGKWLTEREERAWRGYRRMRTLLDLRLTRDLSADAGLSDADYDVLSTLSESADHRWRASELARHLLWSTSRLAHQVGRMEGRGLVRREPAPGDGRGAIVALTDRGWKTLKAAAPGHVRSVRANFIDVLAPGEIDALDRICRKVVGRLSDQGE